MDRLSIQSQLLITDFGSEGLQRQTVAFGYFSFYPTPIEPHLYSCYYTLAQLAGPSRMMQVSSAYCYECMEHTLSLK